jgi:hypothetical protein
VEKATLVHLSRENCLNSLNIGVRWTFIVLAGQFDLGEAGVDVQKAVDARPVHGTRLLEDVVRVDIAVVKSVI